MRMLAALITALLLLASCGGGDSGGDLDQNAGNGTAGSAGSAGSSDTESGSGSTGAPEATATPEPEPGADDGPEPTEPPAEEATPTPLPAPTAAPTATPEPAGVFLPAGSYCYAGDDGINETYVRMTVTDAGTVSGDTRIFISDEENGYFSSAFQSFTGAFVADASIEANLTTWIEFDIQESTESWTATPTELQLRIQTVPSSPCETVRGAYVDVFLPGTDIGVTADELLDRRFFVDERVSFDRGAISATVSNAVIRGEADRYVLEAAGGQLMTIAVSSLEDNAVVDVVSASGIALAVEATNPEIFLPHSGDYYIIVSSSRGNATYDVTITIV